MTRGKHARQVADRAVVQANSSAETLRLTQIEARRLEGIIEDRDREIAQLREALIESRQEHLVIGTYSEAQVEQIRADAREAHRAAVRNGFDFLEANNADRVIPRGKTAELLEAFDVTAQDLIGRHANTRDKKRATIRNFRAFDEAHKAGIQP